MPNNYENIEHSVIPYDQDEIEAVLKQMMYNNGITDVLYPGSNVSQLATVVSYVISSLNINTAINLQETLLPLASKRMNVLFGARQIGYEARPPRSYLYDLNCRAQLNPTHIQKNANGSDYIENGRTVIDKYSQKEFEIPLNYSTKFVCGSYDYYYLEETNPKKWIVSNELITKVIDNKVKDGTDVIDYIPTDEEIAEVYKIITVKEGILHTPSTDNELSTTATTYRDEDGVEQVKQDYLVPFTNVEEEGLSVYLTYIGSFGEERNRELRHQTNQYLIDENMTIKENCYARMENIILGFPTIFFELGGFGQPIRKGTLIEIDALVSSGKDGEAIGRFRVDGEGINLGFEVFNYTLNTKGLSEESNSSIKENAIVYHNTANRAVTKYDYMAITKRHSLIREASAWGGEEEDPKEKGHVWVSCIPDTQTKLIKYSENAGTQTYEIILGKPNNDEPIGLEADYPNLSNWFLTKSTYDNGGTRITEGQQDVITSYLDAYKMMTIEIHYRHPLYIDFEFECDIVKYDVTRSKTDINNGTFQEINRFFESCQEEFEVEYLNSNLQRVIDNYLGCVSGITFNINTYGSLCREMVDEFNLNLNKLETYECPVRTSRTLIRCSLAFPFENMFIDNGGISELNANMLINIDTDNFGGTAEKLWVEYSDLTQATPNQNTNYMKTNMYLGSRLFGEYAVNRTTNTIDITFEFAGSGGSYAVTLDEVFGTNETYVRFNIKYPNSVPTATNIPYTKNTIPRLQKVSFIDN